MIGADYKLSSPVQNGMMLRHMKGNVTERSEKERQKKSEIENAYRVVSKEMKIKTR